MRKCTNNHEMDHNGKHCGECGAVEAAPAMHKCTCGTEFVKSAATRFCTGCGTATEAEADLEQALDGVTAFHKSRAAVEADLAELPPVPSVEADDDEVTAILKSAAVYDGQGKLEGMRPDPLFEAVLAGQASTSADARVIAAHQQRWNQHLATGIAEMAKCMVAMGREIVTLKSQLANQGTQPRPRKIPAVTPAPAPRADGAESKRLSGGALFAKCKLAGKEHPELALGIEEIGALEQHTNLDHSIVEMVKSNRAGLAQRVAALIGEPMPSREELEAETIH